MFKFPGVVHKMEDFVLGRNIYVGQLCQTLIISCLGAHLPYPSSSLHVIQTQVLP